MPPQWGCPPALESMMARFGIEASVVWIWWPDFDDTQILLRRWRITSSLAPSTQNVHDLFCNAFGAQGSFFSQRLRRLRLFNLFLGCLRLQTFTIVSSTVITSIIILYMNSLCLQHNARTKKLLIMMQWYFDEVDKAYKSNSKSLQFFAVRPKGN